MFIAQKHVYDYRTGAEPSPTPTPSFTPTPTPTATPGATPTPTPSVTPSPTPPIWPSYFDTWNTATTSSQGPSSSLYAYSFLQTAGTKSWFDKILYLWPGLGATAQYITSSNTATQTLAQMPFATPLINKKNRTQWCKMQSGTASFSESGGLSKTGPSFIMDTGYHSGDGPAEMYFGIGRWSKDGVSSGDAISVYESGTPIKSTGFSAEIAPVQTRAQLDWNSRYLSTSSIHNGYTSSLYSQGKSGSIAEQWGSAYTSSAFIQSASFVDSYNMVNHAQNVQFYITNTTTVAKLYATVVTDGTLTFSEYEDLNKTIYSHLIVPTNKPI